MPDTFPPPSPSTVQDDEQTDAGRRPPESRSGRPVRKILHVINGESYAGAERVQDLLAMRLPDHGYEVGFACVKPGVFPKVRASRNAPLAEFAMKHKFDVTVIGQIARHARQNGYSAIHTHTVRNAMIGRPAAMLARLPVFHHVHSPVRADTEHGMRNAINAFIDERVVQPGAARLIAVSRSLGDYLQVHGAPTERIRVVPNGVPTASPDCHWRVPVDGWTLGAVALFRPRKGLPVLLEALAKLRASGRPARLLVIGGFESSEYEQEMKRLVDRSGLNDAVEWTGFTDDVQQALARIDLMVLPSTYGEGMPMVLLEAMAMGRPVVASAIDGVPEVLDQGNAGLLVPPNDPEALAAAIRRLIDDPSMAGQLAERAHRRQRDIYSDVAMASAVAGIYDEVLGPGW